MAEKTRRLVRHVEQVWSLLMSINLPGGKTRSDRPDGRLFLTDENLDRGALTLLAAARRLDVRLRNALAAEGLSPLQTSILLELRHSPGIDVAVLRGRMGGTTPTIARVIAELDQASLILRPRKENDGRRRALQLSDKGEELINGALASVRKAMTQVYRQSGEPSVSGALDLLEAVANMSPEEPQI